MAKSREELVAALSATQNAFAADQSEANAKAVAKAQAELDAFDKANVGNTPTPTVQYGEREFDETIEMPVLQVSTDPFEIKRADGTISKKVGGIVLRNPIMLNTGKKLRMLPLTAEQARRLLAATGVAKTLRELAAYIVPGESRVFIDHLVGVSDDSEAFLPQRISFKGESAIAAELLADAKRKAAASTYQSVGMDDLDDLP